MSMCGLRLEYKKCIIMSKNKNDFDFIQLLFMSFASVMLWKIFTLLSQILDKL